MCWKARAQYSCSVHFPPNSIIASFSWMPEYSNSNFSWRPEYFVEERNNQWFDSLLTDFYRVIHYHRFNSENSHLLCVYSVSYLYCYALLVSLVISITLHYCIYRETDGHLGCSHSWELGWSWTLIWMVQFPPTLCSLPPPPLNPTLLILIQRSVQILPLWRVV